MKNNTKGFTLIELLAVIVILAVIALIATPIILNLIDKARIGAAESGAYAYVEAAEKAAVVEMMTNTRVRIQGNCTAAGAKLTCNEAISTTDSSKKTVELTLDLKGDLPTAGTVHFANDGHVDTATGLVINGYTIGYDQTNGAKKA